MFAFTTNVQSRDQVLPIKTIIQKEYHSTTKIKYLPVNRVANWFNIVLMMRKSIQMKRSSPFSVLFVGDEPKKKDPKIHSSFRDLIFFPLYRIPQKLTLNCP